MATAIEYARPDYAALPSLDAWRGMKPALKRAIAARVAGTQDSATIDRVVAHVNEVATGRKTGDPASLAPPWNWKAWLAAVVAVGMAVLYARERRISRELGRQYEGMSTAYRRRVDDLLATATEAARSDAALRAEAGELRAKVAELDALRGELAMLEASRDAAERAWHDAERRAAAPAQVERLESRAIVLGDATDQAARETAELASDVRETTEMLRETDALDAVGA